MNSRLNENPLTATGSGRCAGGGFFAKAYRDDRDGGVERLDQSGPQSIFAGERVRRSGEARPLPLGVMVPVAGGEGIKSSSIKKIE